MPVSGKVLRARRALYLIGAQTNIESFNEDRPEASMASLFYDQSRNELLSEHDWTFARKFQALPESTTDPKNNWTYRYTLPSDFIALRGQVNPQGRKAESPPGQMEAVGETLTLMTDVENLNIWYTAAVSDVLDPMHFEKVHIYLLASYFADSLLGDLERSQLMANRFENALPKAKTIDARQEVADKPDSASWIKNR